MSDTPRTDAVAYDVGGYQHEIGAIVESYFARQLERELNAANDRVKKLEGVIVELTAAGNCVERDKNQLLSILKNQGIFSQFGEWSTDNWIRAKEWDRKEKGLL